MEKNQSFLLMIIRNWLKDILNWQKAAMIFYQNWQGAAAPDKKCKEFFDVTVPGDIQADYARHMGWGDHNYMNNFKNYVDLNEYYWCYKTHVEYEAGKDERVYFVTKGIEYEYDIIMNGKVLLHHLTGRPTLLTGS